MLFSVSLQDTQSSAMNPVYSPVQPGAPYGNAKNMAYTGEWRGAALLLRNGG